MQLARGILPREAAIGEGGLARSCTCREEIKRLTLERQEEENLSKAA